MTMSTDLPEFERPPINEVAMGVQFDSLNALQSARLGLFWKQIRNRYPDTSDQLPLPRLFEPKSSILPQEPPAVLIRNAPTPRCWFLQRDGTVLLQVQQDRLHRNWRQVRGDEQYPRFPSLLKGFQEDWAAFLEFLATEGQGGPQVNLAELLYSNQIQMPGGTSFSNLPTVFPSMGAATPGEFLPPPELVSWAIRYLLPSGRGRIYVEMNPALRATDMKFILNLNLTARGVPAGNTTRELGDWLNFAHEWIVKAFDELTGPKMHEAWGRRLRS